MRIRPLASLVLAAVATCTACTGSGDPVAAPSPSASPSASPAEPSPEPSAGSVTRSAHYYGPNGQQREAELTVRPAVRTDDGLFVSIDLVPQGSRESTGSDYFCSAGSLCRDMAGISLVDADAAVRYGPLRESSAEGDVLSSRPLVTYTPGTTYRFGVFFPDPPSTPDTVHLELLYAGAVLDLPVVDGEVPPEQLGDRGDVDDATDVVVLPVPEPGPDAFVDEHPLELNVVGGDLGEGTAGEQSVVSLAADVLFEFGSADLTPPAEKVVAQAAEILATKADPAQPVAVVGHTDSVGSARENQALSVRRAESVLAALQRDPRLASLALQPEGRGADEPLTANTLPDGSDDPAGRALNRRVTLSYTPQAAPAPPAPSTTPGSARPGGASSGSVRVTAEDVVASGAGSRAMSAVVHPVVQVGQLSLVEVEVTPTAGSGGGGFDYFATRRGDRDVGRWNIVDPTTGAVRAAARDTSEAGDGAFLTGRINLMNGGFPYRLDLWTAALPAGVDTVDVDLGQLGVARGVPVS
jgi:outer membrane protein OmpA-like peptidoglycan-associated protein